MANFLTLLLQLSIVLTLNLRTVFVMAGISTSTHNAQHIKGQRRVTRSTHSKRYNRTLQGKGKGKGGKGGKGYSPKTPAPSISHQPSTSTMPSSQPSISTMPSAKPSSTPSVYPTSQPSSFPSLSPSASPSSQPSASPSSQPSASPSSSPSNQPSISSQPSAQPSISSMPTADVIGQNEAIPGANAGEIIGYKSACKAPGEIDIIRYAEKNVNEIQVQFQYLIRMVESIDGSQSEVVNEVDYQLHSFVFENYIQCQGLISRRRKTQLLANGEFYDNDKAIGVSSLPTDTINSQYSIDNKEFVLVDGGLSLFYEEDASVNPSNEEYNLALFIKNAMDDDQITDLIKSNDSRVESVEFIKGPNLEGSVESLVGSLTLEEDIVVTNSVTLTGGMFIGAALLILVGLLAVARKRRRSIYSGLDKRDPVMMDILDDEDTDVSFPIGLNDEDATFPIRLTETRNGKSKPVSRNINGVKSKIQNVHQCTSALCLQCQQGSQSQIKFISSGLYDDVETASDWLSDATLDFSRPTIMKARHYDSKDTIDL